MTATLNQFAIADLEHAITRTGDALGAMAGGHLLLTGGTGFFGQWLLAAIIHANRTRGLSLTVSVVTRDAPKFLRGSPELATAEGVKIVEADVRSVTVERPSFTHVVHAAADTSLAADADPLGLVDTIIAGTRRILDIAVAAGARDLLFVSSGAVYGGQGDEERVSETYNGACNPLDRRSTYAEAKRMAENLCAIYLAERHLAPRIARAFAFVGPGMPLDAHFAIGNFISDALAGRPIEIKGDGTPMRSYLYAADLVAWLLRALVHGRPGAAYNVGSDTGLSIADIANTVAQTLDTKSPVIVRQTSSPGGFRSRYVPAIDRARSELGVDVWTSLPDAILATAAWARRSHGATVPTAIRRPHA